MENQEDSCRDLHDLLSGNLNAEYLSDIEALRQHWLDCDKCQKLLPNAAAQLEGIEDYALSRIRKNIEQLHIEYRSKMASMLSESKQTKFEPTVPVTLSNPPTYEITFDMLERGPESPSECEQLYTRLLILLAEKGESVRNQLQVINDNWGLDEFRAVSDNDSNEYDSRFCGTLISSLAIELQVFLFQAVLVADIMNKLPRGEFPTTLGFVTYRTVEHAVPEIVRRYLDEQKRLSSDPSVSNTPNEAERERNSGMSDRIEKLAIEVKTVGDSLKAVPEELFRALKGNTYRPDEIDEDLMNLVGKKIFVQLSSETREILNRAELLHRRGLEDDEFRASVFDFHRAYELEFRRRISGPLAQRLIKSGYTRYPLADSPKHLVLAGKFNGGALSLGDQLWFLLHDESVKNILSGLGFDVKEVHREASKLNGARNNAAHDRGCSRTEAIRVRDKLLGSQSIFKSLFPSSYS
jgi:hypothetical protein